VTCISDAGGTQVIQRDFRL